MNEFAELGRLDAAHRTARANAHPSDLVGRASDIAVAIRPLKRVLPALRSRYLVKGWLDRGAFSVIYGESNVGKTFFAMDLGLHVAAGENWHGHRVPAGAKYAGPVLYVAAEGGSGINNRIEAMRREYPNLMKRIEDAGNFSLLAAPLDLCTSNDADYLIDAIREGFSAMPSLIVIDTLARTMGNGDENTAKDMGLFVRNIDMLREVTNAHVMVVHHSGKDASKGARGSGSLRAAADSEIELTRSDDVVMAEARKQRDMPCEGVFAYRLKSVFLGTDDDGDKVTSAVVEQADIQRTDKRERVSGRVQVALTALHDALRDKGRIIRSSELPNVPVVELTEWQACCDRVGLTDSDNADTKARTFRRHRDALMDKNRIRIFDNYVWVTDKADKSRTASDLSATDPDGHGHPPIRVSVCPSVAPVRGSNDAAEFDDPNSAYWQRNES
ncbi:AAA family ATPase [Paracoccus gahaiensis]|uniref:AAA family ATPase n=1 Tax=Paracoccus gahaiensis TaxID=1706839 RepID=A0A4U0RGQ4_9RHOB|nr:helicase RepA family protein [Paracoccus gahaiensis]TJZ93860.1 AAA family ATPase [Paracoccus gahaiensis]